MNLLGRRWLGSLVILLALSHLTWVALFAAHVPMPSEGALGTFMRWYLGISGCNTRYGFFAPNVGTNLRARFEVVDHKGTHKSEILEAGSSRESQIRVQNVMSLFGRYIANPKIERSLTASWAGTVLGRYPAATEVGVFVEVLEFPELSHHARGKESVWREVYRVKFTRNQIKKESSNGI